MSMTVGVLSVVALFVPVSGTLESIAAFVLLPLNACINPLVNTITSAFIQQYNLSYFFSCLIKVLNNVAHLLVNNIVNYFRRNYPIPDINIELN